MLMFVQDGACFPLTGENWLKLFSLTLNNLVFMFAKYCLV